MKIPFRTKRRRYYVASEDGGAFSSWDSFDEAKECIERFKTHNPNDYQKVAGIIRTSDDDNVWMWIKM
jgi:hypothetical protein